MSIPVPTTTLTQGFGEQNRKINEYQSLGKKLSRLLKKRIMNGYSQAIKIKKLHKLYPENQMLCTPVLGTCAAKTSKGDDGGFEETIV